GGRGHSPNIVPTCRRMFCFAAPACSGSRGIVSKRLGSSYRSGRSRELAQDEEPERPRSEARGRGGLGQITGSPLTKNSNATERAVVECSKSPPRKTCSDWSMKKSRKA